tara:strand:+ start:69 stop:326 length:258 start_codon:yes stop_codon:yes gene_type:complete
MALLELDSEKRTFLINARHSLNEAITALDKAHLELASLVCANRLAEESLPELKGDENLRVLLDRSNSLLEETTDLLIDVKEASWT